jgi:citrate lyase beta subunit
VFFEKLLGRAEMMDEATAGVRSLDDGALQPLHERLSASNATFAQRYPGDSDRRQPVHTVYGGAHLFRADSAGKLGAVALRTLDRYAPAARALARAVGLPDAEAAVVYPRVVEKLRRQPVEDFRIDFEDGYGNRPDAEEDGHAGSVALEVARGLAAGTLPGAIGIRVKPLNDELRERSIRTLDLFVTTLVRESGRLPENFVVTLPKITVPEQVAFFAEVLELLERRLSLAEGSLVFEVMVETPQIILDAEGHCPLPRVLDAARGRLMAAHFGTYDYTAACNITAAHQHMQHPACEFARHMMQVAFAGTGVWLSDGSTTTLPVPPHRDNPDRPLPAHFEQENAAVVHRAWKLHYDDVQESLVRGFYQGWDLHPAQLVTRFAAVFSFFLRGLDAAGDRLRNFIQKAAQATLVGEVFDDAATGQGLLNYFLRGINSGAITEEETLARSGLTLAELRSRSFVSILSGRRFSV